MPPFSQVGIADNRTTLLTVQLLHALTYPNLLKMVG